MWRLLEPVYRRWAPFYGVAVIAAALAATVLGAVLEYEPVLSVLVAQGIALFALWMFQATRRALDRREAREALFFKLPMRSEAIAWMRPLDSALPYLALTGAACLAFLAAGRSPSLPQLTVWHAAALGCAVAAFDQLVLWVEEMQVWLRDRGWVGKAAPFIVSLIAGAVGALLGFQGLDWLRGRILSPLPHFGLYVTLAGLAVLGFLAWLNRWVFLRRDHPGTGSCS